MSAFCRIIKTCACGADFTEHTWTQLTDLGRQDNGDGTKQELRQCSICGSTIGVKISDDIAGWRRVVSFARRLRDEAEHRARKAGQL